MMDWSSGQLQALERHAAVKRWSEARWRAAGRMEPGVIDEVRCAE